MAQNCPIRIEDGIDMNLEFFERVSFSPIVLILLVLSSLSAIQVIKNVWDKDTPHKNRWLLHVLFIAAIFGVCLGVLLLIIYVRKHI